MGERNQPQPLISITDSHPTVALRAARRHEASKQTMDLRIGLLMNFNVELHKHGVKRVVL